MAKQAKTTQPKSAPKNDAVVTTKSTNALKQMQSNSDIVFDPFYVPSQDEIHYLEGFPKEWQADCSKKGGFKISGDEAKLHDSIEMEVLLFKEYKEAAFFHQMYKNNPVQTWGIIYFVDEDNKMSTTLLKGRSWRNFIKVAKSIGASGGNVGTKILKAKMKETTSKNGDDYMYVDFSFDDNSATRIKDLKEFYMSNLLVDDDGQVIGTRIYSDFANGLVESSNEYLNSDEYQEYLTTQK